MTERQFAEFAAVMKSAYPKDNLFEIGKAMEVWYRMLKDIDGKVAMAALEKWIATEKWPPRIADIREYSTDIVTGRSADWSVQWEYVLKLIGKYGYWRPNEAYAEMDEATRQTVKRIGYGNLCKSENMVADRAMFRDVYQAYINRQKQDAQIPEQLRMVINGLQVTGPEGGRLEECK